MPEVTHHANFLETPAQRIFAELDGISKYQERDKFKDRGPANDVERSMTVSEDKVVNTYRRGLDVNDFETLSFFNASSFADFSLMEEVVNIINEQKKEQKLLVPYQPYVASRHLEF
ncbi:uncharacterized protein OCT59_017117 [Rhizophagus irregularis]|nr:hypothetical protein RirG_013030 [Rhizophagus irregularis DAOM 197198w]UZO24823.1 hypothetical protein OCT59_017117 [Rhizophagus irregularis]CAG8575533.1 22340_t:CDS:1 [Rhizophagus irregularis]